MKRVCINKVILSPADRNCSGSQPCKQRDPETLRAARLLRMTDEMSSRSVSTPVIPQCLYAGYRSFLLRPIPRIQTLRNDAAAGVRGFTLVELLVVVLIIGILSAIAIPMYQGAVDKSHWSTMLPASKAIKDAEEAFKMTNGEYSDTMEHLDVQISNNDLTFTLNTPNNLSQPNVIKVTNSKLGERVRLASYLDDSPLFAGQLHCEAKTGDERAERLCGKLLMGQELTSADGYTGYLLDQDITKEMCGEASRSWSTSKTKCYKDDQTRCDALNMDYLGNGQCGFIKTSTGGLTSLGKEGECVGKSGRGCSYLDPVEGVVVGKNSLTGSYNTYNGGICVATARFSCFANNYTNGSICYANAGDSCSGGYYESTYDETSCCCGAYCGSQPKCADRGITCDPYYMDPNNFKDL